MEEELPRHSENPDILELFIFFPDQKPAHCYLKYLVNCVTLRVAIINYVSALQTQTKRARHSKQDIPIYLLLKKCGLLFGGMGLLKPTSSNTIEVLLKPMRAIWPPNRSHGRECQAGPGLAAEGAVQTQRSRVSSPGALKNNVTAPQTQPYTPGVTQTCPRNQVQNTQVN